MFYPVIIYISTDSGRPIKQYAKVKLILSIFQSITPVLVLRICKPCPVPLTFGIMKRPPQNTMIHTKHEDKQSVGVRAFVIVLSQISSFFSCKTPIPRTTIN